MFRPLGVFGDEILDIRTLEPHRAADLHVLDLVRTHPLPHGLFPDSQDVGDILVFEQLRHHIQLLDEIPDLLKHFFQLNTSDSDVVCR